jgi:hypothetical protein
MIYSNRIPAFDMFILSIDRLLFGLVSEFLRERSPAMIVRQLPLAARLTLRVGTRDGPTLLRSQKISQHGSVKMVIMQSTTRLNMTVLVQYWH